MTSLIDDAFCPIPISVTGKQDSVMQIRHINQYLQHRLRFITCNRLFGVSLLFTTLLKLRNLGHRSIALWDELYHALVARNLMKHFLKPTFYDQPYLPYDYRGWWQGNHIWLHKSPYAMWQIAISYHIFGVNTFALRFPSLIMSSLAVFITYMIGSELYDKKVGLIAASLQAISPLMMNLVYGYMFSDHINAALIFWVELSCYLLIKGIKTGKTKYYIWSGVAQGFGYLSKSYLCLVSFGILVVIFALTRMNILKPYKENINTKRVLLQILFSILVVAPWVIFCLIEYPEEFIYENQRVLDHLNTEIEIWKRAWDFHLFEYMPAHYPYWYLVIFVSFFFLLFLAMKDRKLGNIYIILWVLAVLLPLSLSASKVPAGTDIAVPALLLCFSAVCFRIIKGKYRIAAIGYFALVFSMFFLSQWPFHLLDRVKNTLVSGIQRITVVRIFAPTLYSNVQIIYQLLCYFAAFAVFFAIYMALRLFRNSLWRERYVELLKMMTVMMLLIIAVPLISESVKITGRETTPDDLEDVGRYIKENLPENSAFILESGNQFGHFYLMFHADRSVYKPRARFDGAWIPRDESSLKWANYTFEADYMIHDRTRPFAINYRYTDHRNFYRFNPSDDADFILWRFWMDGRSSSDDVSYPLFTTERVWYRVQIAVDGRRHIIKVKELSDSTSFNEIKPCMEIDDIHHERGAIGVFGYGYVDNVVVYRIRPDHAKSETLFEDDFESEELDRMPSKWRFFGVSSVGFEAKTVRDPINQNNKVISVSAPHDVEGTARIIKTNGGIPYLVSTAEYDYPLVYKSPVEPHYRIYRLSGAL